MLLSPVDDSPETRAVHDLRATMLPEDPTAFRRRAALRIWSSRALYVAAIVTIAGLVSWGAAEPVEAPLGPAATLAP